MKIEELRKKVKETTEKEADKGSADWEITMSKVKRKIVSLEVKLQNVKFDE